MFVTIMSGYTHAMILNLFVLSHLHMQWSGLVAMYIIYLMALHISWDFTPHSTQSPVILHVSCYSMSRKNEDF